MPSGARSVDGAVWHRVRRRHGATAGCAGGAPCGPDRQEPAGTPGACRGGAFAEHPDHRLACQAGAVRTRGDAGVLGGRPGRPTRRGAPGRLHQRAVLRLAMLLVQACPPDLEVFVAPFGIVFGDDTELQPDVLVARRADLTDKNLPAPPVLAVEVLSPSTRIIDSHVKRERFEREGTPAFWVVDPVARPDEARLVAWELAEDGRYRQVADVLGEAEHKAGLPYPVTVRPADLVR